MNWSDPATWLDRTVPAAGDKVIIGKDRHVVLDVSPPALGGLSIDGKLTFSNNTVGHCFFMEDGIEHGNQFVRNLAIQTKCHTSKPCDPTDLAPFGSTADLFPWGG